MKSFAFDLVVLPADRSDESVLERTKGELIEHPPRLNRTSSLEYTRRIIMRAQLLEGTYTFFKTAICRAVPPRPADRSFLLDLLRTPFRRHRRSWLGMRSIEVTGSTLMESTIPFCDTSID